MPARWLSPLLAVFGTSWGLALGIALLLVFVMGGFVVLASATATGESDDGRPASTGHQGPGDDDARSAAVVNLGGDGTTAADAMAGSRGIRVGYAMVALAAAAVMDPAPARQGRPSPETPWVSLTPRPGSRRRRGRGRRRTRTSPRAHPQLLPSGCTGRDHGCRQRRPASSASLALLQDHLEDRAVHLITVRSWPFHG